ncbi:MAG TPA: hypothetical protein VN442_05975 [Bryobacteraceae bacterium]|nr:hypothetical protein [Bryobacteraceae bacterium]
MTKHVRRICFVCALLSSAFVVSCSGPAGHFRAGAAAVDITPQAFPVPMRGTFSFRPATTAHDPLHARALVLDDGRTRLAMVIIDNVGIPRSLLDEAKRIASEATGIPTNRILTSSTHTHTAPYPIPQQVTDTWDKKTLPPEEAAVFDMAYEANVQYSGLLKRQIAKAIQEAAARLQPAEIGAAVVQLPEHLNNRRWFKKEGSIPPSPYGATTDRVQMNPQAGSEDLVKPAGPTDPGLSVISVRTSDGKPLALLANYSLHYVGDVPGGQISADYFGEFAKRIRQSLAPDNQHFVGILSNGTSGDVNNINFRAARGPRGEPSFSKISAVADSVAKASLQAYKTIQHSSGLSLAMAEREINLGVRKPTAEQLQFAKAALAAKDDKKLPGRAKAYAKRALALEEEGETVSIKLQAIRIGSIGIAAIPFEVFTETGLEIKEKSPLKPTFTIELANGSEGYLPTPEQHKLGGYETWLGTNRVEIQASRKITDTVLELLKEVSTNKP